MILANFDLSFFTSIPGLLITGGVLLLLIALIIFIATGSKKGKKEKNEGICLGRRSGGAYVYTGIRRLSFTWDKAVSLVMR